MNSLLISITSQLRSDIQYRNGIGENNRRNTISVSSKESGMFVYGVSGCNGTNAGQSGVKTLQTLLSSLNS